MVVGAVAGAVGLAGPSPGCSPGIDGLDLDIATAALRLGSLLRPGGKLVGDSTAGSVDPLSDGFGLGVVCVACGGPAAAAVAVA